MPVCYFDNNYKKKYNCEYEKNENGIKIIVDYDITDEIQSINGVKSFTSNTEFSDRDILIVDNISKMNYLLKYAHYYGHTMTFGTPDGGIKTKFESKEYLYAKDYESLVGLKRDLRISKIRIYSNLINELIGNPSVKKTETNDELCIELQKKSDNESCEINNNNISKITISDSWSYINKFKNNEINIKLNGYIELMLKNKIEFELIYEYITEVIVFLQLHFQTI